MGQYKCCCCIPVRAGVLIIALLSAAIYIMSTVGLFLVKANDDQSYLNNTDFTYNMTAVNGVFYTTVAVTILFSLASLFGVIGSITQHRKMIVMFKMVYWFVVILQFIVTVAVIIVLAVNRSEIIGHCTLSSEAVSLEDCTKGFKYMMIAFSVIVMIINFIQFYFATAISAYAARLRRTNMHEKLRNLEDFPEPPSKQEFF
ncbi:hypothetical protein BDF21DRAFT_419939 [Thamnidium elegans]|nr:hypothetical protein BDF21DRAFT_419939 [Thamnidium elegans]